MGIVVEIYSADPQELEMLFAMEPDPEKDDIYFEQLGRYPMADFSFSSEGREGGGEGM